MVGRRPVAESDKAGLGRQGCVGGWMCSADGEEEGVGWSDGGVSRRCLTSPHGGPAGSKNGAAALLGGNGAGLLHGAGESRTEDGPSWGAAGVQCMHAAAAAAVQATPALRVACCPPLGSVLKDYVAINGQAGHQAAGGAVAGGAMHVRRRRCSAGRGPHARPCPSGCWRQRGGAHLRAISAWAAVHARPAAGRRGKEQTVPDGTRRGWSKRGMGAGRAEGGTRVPERSTPLRHGVFPGRAAPTRPGSAIGASGTVHRRAQPAPRAAPQRSPSPPRAQAPPAAPPLRMAAPQVAGARAVLGLGVRAAQAPELKHQAAKQFFKEVGGALGNRGGSIAGPWTRARRPGSLHQASARRRSGQRACRLPLLQPSRCNTAARSRPHVQVCRCLPWVVDNYRLDELTTVPELRRNLAAMFRKYTDVQVGAHALVTCTARPKLCHSCPAPECTLFCRAVAVAGGREAGCPSQPQSSAGCRTHQHDAAFLCATRLVQSPEVVDLLIYKGREELEVRA